MAYYLFAIDPDGNWPKLLKKALGCAEAEYWAALLAPEAQTRIQHCDSARHFSVFTAQQLSAIYMQAKGPSGKWLSYEQAVQETAQHLAKLPVDTTDAHTLRQQLGRDIHAGDRKLVSYSTRDAAPLTDAPPQPVPRPASLPVASRSKPTSPPPLVPTVAKQVKAVTAPKRAGACAQVWEIAAAQRGKKKPPFDKAFRTQVIAACEAAGVNKSTASVQYGKWLLSLNTSS